MLEIGGTINLEMYDHFYVPEEAPVPEAAVWFLNHALKMHRKTYSLYGAKPNIWHPVVMFWSSHVRG